MAEGDPRFLTAASEVDRFGRLLNHFRRQFAYRGLQEHEYKWAHHRSLPRSRWMSQLVTGYHSGVALGPRPRERRFEFTQDLNGFLLIQSPL